MFSFAYTGAYFIEKYLDKRRKWTYGWNKNRSTKKTLDLAHTLAGNGSLIKININYIQQRKIYEGHTSKVRLSKWHGLRHKLSQDLYFEITGLKAPVFVGPK